MIGRALEGAARYGTFVMAGALLAGYLLPGVAHVFRPWIGPAILAILTIAMVRLDADRLRGYARRPGLLAVIVAVNLIGAPLLVWLVVRPIGLAPGLEQGLVLMAAAPMVSSAIAFAAILGLDSALAVAVMVASYAVVPLSLPALSLWLIGLDLGVGFLELFGRLFGLIAAPAAVAIALRRWVVRRETLAARARAIDGFGILFIAVFCLGIMDGMQSFTLARPGFALFTLVVAFAANIGLQALGTLLFLRLGRREALTVGLITGNCNLGLVLVTLADRASPELVAYFVLGQVPMYFLPVVALPVYRRLIPA